MVGTGSFISALEGTNAHDTLEAAEGEMLQVSDYLSQIGTIASGLGMLGLAEVQRLLLRITA